MKGPTFVGATIEHGLPGMHSPGRITATAPSSSSSSGGAAPPPATGSDTASSARAALTPKKSANPFGIDFSFSSPVAETQAAEEGSTQQVDKQKGKKGGTGNGAPKSPKAKPKGSRPGKNVNAGVAKDRAAAAGGVVPKGRGRPSHDAPTLALEQVKAWKDCIDTDEIFFGSGFVKHKGFLTRTKNAIGIKMQTSTERCLVGVFFEQEGRSINKNFCFSLTSESGSLI